MKVNGTAVIKNKEYNLKIGDWNILKLSKKDFKYSLLNYPTFFEDSYPALDTSYTIDLTREIVRHASYKDSESPPILHRKDIFLPPNHPKTAEFQMLTREGEEIGLYDNTRSIGFRNNWEKHIRRKGYELIDGHICSVVTCKSTNEIAIEVTDNPLIERHRNCLIER